MEADRVISVALLENAPAPYRTPFFNELAKRCRLLVSFDAKREEHRSWEVGDEDFEFEWVVTRGLSIPRSRPRRGPLHLPLNVGSVLSRFQPDVVVSSELGLRTASAAVYCGVRKRPLIVWWEGTPSTDGANAATTARRRLLLRRAVRSWGNGDETSRSLRAYGVPQSRIDLGMTGSDTARWRREVDVARVATRSALRAQLGLVGNVVLFVGHLRALKGVPELLQAFTTLAETGGLPPWSALFVGSGPLDREIDRWARAHPNVPVAMTGFVQPRDLAKYYAAADLFAMPSLIDRWGLVCLDAVVAGVPQVTSRLTGAAADLVTSEEIGVAVDPRDIGSLSRQLEDRIRSGPRPVPEVLRDRAMRQWSVASMAERAMSSIRLGAAERTG